MEGQQNLGTESSIEQHKISAEEEVPEGENETSKKIFGMGGKKEDSTAIAGTGFPGNGGRWKKSHATFHTRAHEEFIKHARTVVFC